MFEFGWIKSYLMRHSNFFYVLGMPQPPQVFYIPLQEQNGHYSACQNNQLCTVQINTHLTTGNPNISVLLAWGLSAKTFMRKYRSREVIEGINFKFQKIGRKNTDSYRRLCYLLYPSFAFHIMQRLFGTTQDAMAYFSSILYQR